MILREEFLQLLKDPASEKNISTCADDSYLCTDDGSARFPVREGIPVMLPSRTFSAEEFNYEEHYSRDAEEFDYEELADGRRERSEIARLHEFILAEIPEDARWVLDVGCGSGWLAAALLPRERNVISMDISYRNPKKAMDKMKSPNHFALVADAFSLPIKAASLDCVIASEILEHTVDPKAFIESLMRVLKPGGKLIVTTPYNEHIRHSLCIHCNQPTPHNAHLHSFKESSIRNTLPANISSHTIRVFNSKLLAKTGLTHLFLFLPLFIWKKIDQLFTFITNKKSYRLMLTIIK